VPPMIENWKSVPGWDATYEVSDHGRVRRLAGPRAPVTRIIGTKPVIRGYHKVTLHRRGWGRDVLVHRLVYEVFVGPIPDGKTINHKDGDKSNNTVGNLEVLSLKKNIRHAIRTGLASRVRSSKLTEAKVIAMRERMQTVSAAAAGREFGVTNSTACKIRRRQLWSHLPPAEVVGAGCRVASVVGNI
jgi:hypothetical protein